MNKKYKSLLIIFTLLLIVFIISNLFDKKSDTFEKTLFSIDSSLISKIVINPEVERGLNINLEKKNNEWILSKPGFETKPKEGSVEFLISELSKMKVQALVSKTKDDWEEYNVNEDKGTIITAFDIKGQKVLDVIIGRFEVGKASSMGMEPSANQVIGYTYFRLNNSNETYSASSYLSLQVNAPFDFWRNATLFSTNKENITGISFKVSNVEKFKLLKDNNIWTINGNIADSLKVYEYLQFLSRQDLKDFNDDFKVVAEPDYNIIINETNKPNIEISAWQTSDSTYVVKSSTNLHSTFNVKNNDHFFINMFRQKESFN